MGSGESNMGTTLVQVSGASPVTDAAKAVRDFAAGNEIKGSDLSRLCVIVEELVANLYEHGGLAQDDRVELTLSAVAHGVRIVMVDPGRPFDPRTARSGHRRPERGGGAGLDIVRNWASQIDYRLSDGRNRLELLIPVRSDRSGGAAAPPSTA